MIYGPTASARMTMADRDERQTRERNLLSIDRCQAAATCSLVRLSSEVVAPPPHLGSRLYAPRSVAMSRLLDRLFEPRKQLAAQRKQLI